MPVLCQSEECGASARRSRFAARRLSLTSEMRDPHNGAFPSLAYAVQAGSRLRPPIRSVRSQIAPRRMRAPRCPSAFAWSPRGASCRKQRRSSAEQRGEASARRYDLHHVAGGRALFAFHGGRFVYCNPLAKPPVPLARCAVPPADKLPRGLKSPVPLACCAASKSADGNLPTCAKPALLSPSPQARAARHGSSLIKRSFVISRRGLCRIARN